MTPVLQNAALVPLFLCTILLAACTTPSPAPPPSPSGSRPATASPPARYNLAGYSDAFKQGYADACASPRRRSEQRFKTDTDYQMGWNDGLSLCRTR